MQAVALGTAGLLLLLVMYTYVVYPVLLWLAAAVRSTKVPVQGGDSFPTATVLLPVYNEEAIVAEAIQRLLALRYPRDRLQILVISDASTDGTDEIVKAYAEQGVELLRLAQRSGKTEAENRGRAAASGEIIVNLDASTLVAPDALKCLVGAFADPGVGVASGRDVSVAPGRLSSNAMEGGYVGYEMWVRSLETKVAGIVGSSGCFFASRARLFDAPLAGDMSWDFAAPLIARERGYRAVSVPEAVCFVPRASSLRREYRRKVRTMTRGIRTLSHFRHLLDPTRYGSFAWMLFSHKVCRWTLPWCALAALLAIIVMSFTLNLSRWLLTASGALLVVCLMAWYWPEQRRLPQVLSLPAFVVVGNVAAMHAAVNALRGAQKPTWEPTRRDPAPAG